MFSMAANGMVLFFRGKLFREPSKAYRQLALGIAITLLLMLGAVFAGAAEWQAASIAGFAGGALQPYLFRHLKFR